jgi:hypothetical protein
MSKFYKVADLVVEMESFGRSVEQARPYEITGEHTPDIVISTDWQSLKDSQPHLSEEDCEYLCTGGSFYRQLVNFDGLLLHSSAVVVDGRAYLFSAPCGTGKSTHTKLWLKHFGDRATMLNDDKPALRITDEGIMCCGTPFSGKHDISENRLYPVKGIAFIERAEANSISRISPFTSLPLIMQQTVRNFSEERGEKFLTLLSDILTQIPVYQLKCNMDPEAAHVSLNGMK